jgi:hypothetical protein
MGFGVSMRGAWVFSKQSEIPGWVWGGLVCVNPGLVRICGTERIWLGVRWIVFTEQSQYLKERSFGADLRNRTNFGLGVGLTAFTEQSQFLREGRLGAILRNRTKFGLGVGAGRFY